MAMKRNHGFGAQAPRRLVKLVGVALVALGGAAAPAARASEADEAFASAPVAQDLSYRYDYRVVGWPQTQLTSPEQVLTMVANNFTSYFTFQSNCPQLPEIGGTCNLTFAGVSNPVQLAARTSTSFTFLSLPGHSEGAGRYINFSFYMPSSDPSADIRMEVRSWGPWSAAAAATVNSGAANGFWSTFAANIANAFH